MPNEKPGANMLQLLGQNYLQFYNMGKIHSQFMCCVFIGAFVLPASADIYGPDDRHDLLEANGTLRKIAEGSVSLWSGKWYDYRTHYNPFTKTISPETSTLKKSDDFCPDANFAQQPTGPFCSGALVGEDLVLTAGHCVKDLEECKDTSFIFGFEIGEEGADPARSRPASESLYNCVALLSQSYDEDSGTDNFPKAPDFALIRLDRKVKGRQIMRLSPDESGSPGTPVAYIGYPHGLPLKIADNARILPAANKDFITADLDVNPGASGSPVIDMNTGLIVGIVAKSHVPDTAYHQDLDCKVDKAYFLPTDGSGVNEARGVTVTRVSAFSGLIRNRISSTGRLWGR